jgi:hypothetical protein
MQDHIPDKQDKKSESDIVLKHGDTLEDWMI